MKNITEQDIQILRQHIMREHDRFLKDYLLMKENLQAEAPLEVRLEELLGRLDKAEEKLEMLLELPVDELADMEAAAADLFRELKELGVFFGMYTARPLEDCGVAFVAPYIRTLRLIFRFEPSMKLYVDMIRTELALLEYQLEHKQDFVDCLYSLKDSVEFFQYAHRMTEKNDALQRNLQAYLLDIHDWIAPMMYEKEIVFLKQIACELIFYIGVAFAEFECLPEEPEEMLLNSLIVAMLMPFTEEEVDVYTALCCQRIAMMLLSCPLSEEKKSHVLLCCMKAEEVLGDA